MTAWSGSCSRVQGAGTHHLQMDEKGKPNSAISHMLLCQPVACRGLHDQAQWSSCHTSVLVGRVRHVKAERKPGSWQLDLDSRFAGACQPRLWGPLLLSGLAAGAGTACHPHGRWQRGPGSGILPGTCTAGCGPTVCRQWCFDISALASVLGRPCFGHQCFGQPCFGISALASVLWQYDKQVLRECSMQATAWNSMQANSCTTRFSAVCQTCLHRKGRECAHGGRTWQQDRLHQSSALG